MTTSPAVGVRTSATRRWPAPRSAATAWVPTNPLAPVTRMVDIGDPLLVQGRPAGDRHLRFGPRRSTDAVGRSGGGIVASADDGSASLANERARRERAAR